MKRHLSQTILLLSGFFISGVYGQTFAADAGHDIIVRNALDQPIDLAVTSNGLLQSGGESSLRSHWEMILKDVKLADLSKNLALAAQIRSAGNGKVGPEIARCQLTLSQQPADPRLAVIIHQSKEASLPQCDIVDLNAFQTVAAVPASQTPERSVASRN